MSERQPPKPGEVYRHVTKVGEYVVLGLVRVEQPDPQGLHVWAGGVWYAPISGMHEQYVRTVERFLARFELLR